MRFHLTALFVLVSFVLPGLAQTQAKRSQTADRSQQVQTTARVLAETYDENTGLFRGTGWWNSANGISALVEAARVLHTTATTWTYNQGVVLSGLSGLAKLTHDPAPLQLADHIAAAVGRQLVDAHGVLHDPCESDCGGDGVQFKGILVRNLVTLQQAHPSPEIVTLLDQNAESVWKNARTENGHFSVNWAGPPQDSGTGSLISALDALASQVLIEQSERR